MTSYSLLHRLTFNQLQVVEPGVVVHRVGRDLLLVLELPLPDDDVLDADALAELLLVRGVVLVQLGARVLRQAVECEPIDGARTIVLLKSGKRQKSDFVSTTPRQVVEPQNLVAEKLTASEVSSRF